MAYRHQGTRVGAQAIANTSTTQIHPIGLIVQAEDPTYGVGEFIYLKGVASTAVGSLVTYNSTTGVTTLAPVGANKADPIAVAMAATGASECGWYQISGQAVMRKSSAVSLAAAAVVGVKTAGLVASTGSGKEIQGAAVMAVASAASGRVTVLVLINRPRMQGRVT